MQFVPEAKVSSTSLTMLGVAAPTDEMSTGRDQQVWRNPPDSCRLANEHDLSFGDWRPRLWANPKYILDISIKGKAEARARLRGIT